MASTEASGGENEEDLERFNDFALASSWERLISEIEAICLQWLADGPKNLLKNGLVQLEFPKNLYRVKFELKYAMKSHGMDYYFETNSGGKTADWDCTLHDLQLCFDVKEFLVIAPQSANGVVLDAPEASKLLGAVAIALSNCSSLWPAFVPVHDPSRKAYNGIQNMGTVFARRLKADLIAAQFIEDFVSAANPGSDNLNSSMVVPPPTVMDHVLKDLFHDAIAKLWVEFIREVRWCWEESQPLPKMPANGSIDLSTCLIHQKLQMNAAHKCCFVSSYMPNGTASHGNGQGSHPQQNSPLFNGYINGGNGAANGGSGAPSGAGGGEGAGAGGGEGAGAGGGEGAGAGGGSGLGGGAVLRIPILSREQNQITLIGDFLFPDDMNRTDFLNALHLLSCNYTHLDPQQNVTIDSVWPGRRVILRGLHNPHDHDLGPLEDVFIELNYFFDEAAAGGWI